MGPSIRRQDNLCRENCRNGYRLFRYHRKTSPLAEENGHKDEVDTFLAEIAHSKHRDGSYRTRQGLLEGRFKIGKIQRIEMSAFQDACGLKIFDFSKQTIRQLITQGQRDAMSRSLSEK
ncbi:MAG: hypothetical protein M3P08_11030 [Thermoproteota archaeon]|nr:hypothetical protein [Thermoproteota archaeon]